MNILIDSVRVAGFRGIKNLEISLPRVAVLIGQNNSGKTTFLKALQLALGDYSRALSEEDFYIGADGSPAAEIMVDVRIVPVDTDGKRVIKFDSTWQAELGDIIMPEATGHQFVALRTRSMRNLLKGNFDTKRATLDKWPDRGSWTTEKVTQKNLVKRLESLPFFAIEAQRDIHQELSERTSFVGRVLSGIKYNEADVTALEDLIKGVNDEAVSKSKELKSLKHHLQQLNKSFDGDGSAEITPLPKKIRDLSKHVSVQFGENSANSFSMEYHGMGTRSAGHDAAIPLQGRLFRLFRERCLCGVGITVLRVGGEPVGESRFAKCAAGAADVCHGGGAPFFDRGKRVSGHP